MKNYKKLIIGLAVLYIIPVVLWAASEKPIAQFTFEKTKYQQSESIKAIDTSYTINGSKITQREWMISVDGKRKKGNHLPTLLKDVKAGTQEVFLHVKDASGIWSDWVSQKIVIEGLKVIKITNFKVEKNMYAKGEKLEFIVDYENPNDLAIRSQRWRYKNLTTGGSTISSKPKYFSRAGTYEVSLELQDEWGNWSNKAVCKVQVGNEQIERTGEYLFKKGKQGDLLDGYIDKDYNTFDELTDVTSKDIPGTLIMSNSPENVQGSGILYKDTTEGKGILLVHHQNNTAYDKKLMIFAETVEKQPVHLEISNEAIKGPSTNILKTGQISVSEYFKGKSQKEYVLKTGKMTCIYDSSVQGDWKTGQIVSGLLDFNTDGKVTFTIVVMDKASQMSNLPKLSVLKKDVHIRGTFDVIQREYTVNITDLANPAKLVVGREEAEWLVGKDALTGEIVKNKGNYGLPIVIKVKSKEDMGIIINARGGNYLGAIKWNGKKTFDVPREDILNAQKLAALIGTAKANEVNEFLYMLPNGSSAPVLFGFVPEHLWK